MLFLKKSKESLENESYIYGKNDNQQMIIPLHECDEIVGICPQCGKITTVDNEIIYEVMKELYDSEKDLEEVCNLTAYCGKCSTERHMNDLKKTKSRN